MKITLSKCIPAKWESEDPATDGFRSRVLASISGSFEEEIRVNSLKGGGR